jgi:hypothetical protein
VSPNISSAALAAHLAQRAEPALKTLRQRRAPTRKEREIQAAILDFLRTVPGIVAWRQNTGGAMLKGAGGVLRPVRFGFPGLSDIIGWREPGARFLAIEVKKPGEYPSPEQRAFLQMVHRANGVAIVAHSVQDVIDALGLTARR